MKRYLAFAVLLCLMFTSIPVIQGYAVEITSDIAVDIGVLNTLGIVAADEMDADLNQLVTRAEFVAKSLKMMKINSYDAGITEPLFTDVPEEHYYHNMLIQAVAMGIISGNGNGTFEPDNPITLGQACKIMLYTIGYNQVMEASGNSLSDCYRVANRLNLLLGISTVNIDELISLQDAYQIIFNALHTEMCEVEYMTADGVYSYKEGATVLKNVYNIEYAEGVVESDYYNSLSRTTTDEGFAVIDGITYKNMTESGLVGYKVRCYYYSQSGRIRTALYAYKLENVVTELDSSDVSGYDGSAISTKTNSGSQKRYAVAADASVIYNGKLLENTYEIADKLMAKATKITLINNDDDSSYEVLYINHYKNIFVSRIDRSNAVIYGESVDSSNEKIDLDYYERHRLVLADGTQISLDNVMENYVISVCIESTEVGNLLTEDDSLLIYVSPKSTMDTIKAKNTETITITEGDEIPISSSAVKSFDEIPFGTSINIYYDAFGEAVYYSDGETSLKTGYLIDIAEGTFGAAKIRMFDKISGISEYEVRNKVRTRLTDGTSKDYTEAEFYKYVTGNSLTRVPVLFSLSSSSELTEMWFLSNDQKVKFHKIRDDIFEDITANEYSTLFIYKSASRGFMAKLMFRDASSEVLVVPKKGTFDSDEESFYQLTTSSYFTNGARFNCGESGPYKAIPVSMQEDGFMTDLLVWEVDGSASLNANGRTSYGIVTDILETWNSEKGEAQLTLEFTSYAGTAISLTYDGKLGENAGPYDSTNKIEVEAGDLIAYGLDAKGNISDKTMVVCYDASEKEMLTTIPTNTYYRWDLARISVGEILQRDEDFILLKAMRALDGSGTSIECHNIASALVYTYDSKKRILKSESIDKIAGSDKFLLTMTNGVIDMIVYYE